MCKIAKNLRFKRLSAMSLWVAVLALTVSCAKKIEKVDNYEVLELPVDGQIRDLLPEGDSLWIVGGDHGSPFFLNYHISRGEFRIVDVGDFPDIYSISRNGDGFYLGLETSDLLIVDGNLNVTPHYTEEKYWINQQHKQPLRDAVVADSLHIFVGGGDLRFGVIRKGLDDGQFVQSEYMNDLRGIAQNDNWMYVVGNGIILRSGDNGETWERRESTPAFYTSMIFDESGRFGYMCTFNGDLYSSDDYGQSWDLSARAQKFFKDGYFLERMAYTDLAVGNNGSIARWNDDEWQFEMLDVKDDFYDAAKFGNRTFFGGNGRLIITAN
ncbi:MAG: hypothetical protein RI562_10015 [Salibacter sp.]|uniref:WD40/YVTN/BNR-like repeat-containing protein n=1 Tax=Salibacter sp. TaxID=2010995 RepID=UPI00287094A9|nr:hypothetical protein [Salibacter sp.]MDR9399386.1 hypothetical protein [Salibacter sp.]